MAVTSAQIVDFLLANPGLSDAEIVSSMETYGVSPAQMAAAVGLDEGAVAARAAATIPQGQTITLGDTIVQPQYQIIGSGEDQQIGALETVYTYKVGENQTGGGYNQYTATGELERTGTQQKVDSGLGEFALGAGLLFGGLGGGLGSLLGGGGAATLGTTGLTATELAQLDLALGGAGGTAGATSLAGALTTGAEVGTLTNLTGGSGLLTGEAGGITAQSVADKLAADAAAQAAADAATKAAADATAKAAADVAAAKAAADAAAAKAAADAAIGADAATKAAADAAAAKAAADAAAAKVTADAAAAAATASAATASTTAAASTAATAAAATAATTAANTAATTSLTSGLTTGLTTGLTNAATSGLVSGLTSGLGGLTAAQIGALLSGALTTGGGLLQQQTSAEAARTAQAKIDAETAAAKQAAAFRPIGMTTRFGTSQFQIDPKTGQLVSAGYTLDPQAKNAQDRLVKLAEQGLQQAEGAQAQFAPLQTGAQSLFGLGQGFLNAQNDPRLAQIASQYLAQSPESQRLTALGGDYLTQSPESKMLTALGSKYIAQSPQEVAQNYLNQQIALLQPGRELELANLQNKLQQQGRGGLAVAQGGTLGATTPELQALYNARATQEAQLAANAQLAGQQQVQFGAGLVGTGQQLGIQGQQFGANLIGTGQNLGIQGQQFGMDTLARQQALEQQRLGFGSGLLNQGAGLMGQYYAGQQAAYAPYTTAMGQVQNLETLAQQPYNMSLALAQQQAQAGANVGQLGLRGAEQSVALATGKAATTNPYSTLLGGLGASSGFGQAAGGLLGGLFGSQPATSGFSYGQYGTGIDPSTGEYFGSLYF